MCSYMCVVCVCVCVYVCFGSGLCGVCVWCVYVCEYMCVYKNWHEVRYDFVGGVPFELGKVQVIETVASKKAPIFVANMIAQNGVRGPENPKPIKYEALVNCMQAVAERSVHRSLQHYPVEIHAPKFGSDLAGGNWSFIEELIEEIWKDFSSVTIYQLEE